MPFSLTRTGDARIEAAARSAPIGKELEGTWHGTLDVNGIQRRLVLTMANQPDGTATGTFVNVEEGLEIPITTITQKASSVTLDVKTVGGVLRRRLEPGWHRVGRHADPGTGRPAADVPAYRGDRGEEVAQPFRAAVGRPEGLRYERPPITANERESSHVCEQDDRRSPGAWRDCRRADHVGPAARVVRPGVRGRRRCRGRGGDARLSSLLDRGPVRHDRRDDQGSTKTHRRRSASCS